jgi:hypothetical protein
MTAFAPPKTNKKPSSSRLPRFVAEPMSLQQALEHPNPLIAAQAHAQHQYELGARQVAPELYERLLQVWEFNRTLTTWFNAGAPGRSPHRDPAEAAAEAEAERIEAEQAEKIADQA